ncbi:MAG: YdcF family protein [Limnothrix sp. RL_2_0]|nr:YdcF family protein [Limnothrix sp. RL_2_0]
MTALFIRVLLGMLFLGLMYWVLWKLLPRKLFTFVGAFVVLALIGLSFYNPAQVVSVPDPIWKLFIFPFQPLGIALILSGVSLFQILPSGTNKTIKNLMLISFGLLLLCSMPISTEYLVNFYEQGSYPKPDDPIPQAPVIVLMGHGTTETTLPFKDAIQLTETGDRLLYTVILYRQQNQKPKVIISAGERDYLQGEQKNRLEANDISNILEDLGVDEGNIRLESVSRDIRSSAVKVKELLDKEGLGEQQIILVTSAIKMRRSRLAFEKIGLNVTPAPTDFHGLPDNEALKRRLSVDDFLPTVEALSLSSNIIEDSFGFIYYFVRGWISISL